MTLPRGFPRRTLRGDREIYRIHRADLDPWWFSSDGTGRFDPVGTGLGACYLAEAPLGAWVEVFRKAMVIAEPDIHGRSLFGAQLGRDLKLADLTSHRALQFGVTATLGANAEYRESQAIAADAVAAGFDGLRYFVRHDPAQNLAGLALFAQTGEADDETLWPGGRDTQIPADLIADARRDFNYRVLPVP